MIIIRAVCVFVCVEGMERTKVSLCHIPSSRRICPGRRQGFKSCGTLLGPGRKQCLQVIFRAAGRYMESWVGGEWGTAVQVRFYFAVSQ